LASGSNLNSNTNHQDIINLFQAASPFFYCKTELAFRSSIGRAAIFNNNASRLLYLNFFPAGRQLVCKSITEKIYLVYLQNIKFMISKRLEIIGIKTLPYPAAHNSPHFVKVRQELRCY
jgi:hypothetical protein